MFDQTADRLNIEGCTQKPICGDDGFVGSVLMTETKGVFDGELHSRHLQTQVALIQVQVDVLPEAERMLPIYPRPSTLRKASVLSGLPAASP